VNRVLLGKDSVNAIARIYEVDRGFVRSWSDAYKYHGVDGLSPTRPRRQNSEIRYLSIRK